jgi:pimeloyl-ACP methyl ester carboxylesterase
MNGVDLSQGTISYREAGSGQPIVFVHGLLVNGRLWERVVPKLSESFRCIVPDWPLGSHRMPMNPDADLSPMGIAATVAAFLDELGLEQVTLVGNDSGGAISQIVATRHPERVGRLILTNCDAYDDFPPKLFSYLGLVAKIPGGVTATAQSLRFKPLRRSPIAFGVLTESRLDDDMLDDWVRPGLESAEVRRDTRKFLRAMSPKYTRQAAKDLESFAAPTLFAWAPEDRWFKVEHADRLAASMPDARVVRIPGSKTFVALDQPEALADAIGSFMRETKPAAVAA